MIVYKKLRLGIVGFGFVGKATDYGFNKKVNKFIVDPILNTTVEDLKKFKPEIVFICVPTPMGEDGCQDCSIIVDVLSELHDKCREAVKVIKSTVLPSVLEKLHQLDSKIVYNPEFLREKHANIDFINSEMIILGGDRNISTIVSKAYSNHSRCKTNNHIFTDLKSASLIKYAINTFLASKVVFFNELYDLYNTLDVNDSWESVIEAISNDSRIGKSHMNVPGHDGKKGFGGACFPKDTLALAKYADDINIELKALKASIKKNNEIRSKYSSLDQRESEQNITFDDKI